MKTVKYDDRVETLNDKGEVHSFDGKPAIEWVGGSKGWFKEGKIHRVDGPAIEQYIGYECKKISKCWFYEGKRIHCNSTEEFLKIINLKAFW